MIKNLYFILMMFPLFALGQKENQETLAKFIITDAKFNGVDITPRVIEDGAYTVFYNSGNDGLIYMANVFPISNSQSFGPMYGVESEKYEESYENYAADFFYFNWQYNNTYDNKTGTAKVQVIKVYKPQGVAFTVKIIPENLDVMIYKGYMEGTVDFNKFNKFSSNNSRFRRDYTHVSIYDMNTESWSEWESGDNTFVLNHNENGDIAHYKANGEIAVYKRISEVEDDYTSSGDHYQIITALDENGSQFMFQFFDKPNIGLKLIYGDMMFQFAKF